MKQVLTFNITEEVKKIFQVLNVQVIEVKPNEQNQTLEYLFTKKQELRTNSLPFKGFEESLIIFNGFEENDFDSILRILKVNGYGGILKAVVTDTNIHWPAILLYNELIKERAQFNKDKAGS